MKKRNGYQYSYDPAARHWNVQPINQPENRIILRDMKAVNEFFKHNNLKVRKDYGCVSIRCNKGDEKALKVIFHQAKRDYERELEVKAKVSKFAEYQQTLQLI